jgi:hypothetical protein
MGAEADRRVATMEFLKAAVDYKKHWHQVLAERARTGTTGPEPVPHPDDVLIDYETGNIRIDGPVMEDQNQARDQLRAIWPKLERELMGINEQIESDPNNLSLRKRKKSFLRTTLAKKPRTECCCQPVAFMMAAIVVPLGCLSRARTASCLVPLRVMFPGFAGCFARLLARANLVFLGVLLCDI